MVSLAKFTCDLLASRGHLVLAEPTNGASIPLDVWWDTRKVIDGEAYFDVWSPMGGMGTASEAYLSTLEVLEG